jgi:hypothetical protein
MKNIAAAEAPSAHRRGESPDRNLRSLRLLTVFVLCSQTATGAGTSVAALSGYDSRKAGGTGGTVETVKPQKHRREDDRYHKRELLPGMGSCG